jgi:hypothetical protein
VGEIAELLTRTTKRVAWLIMREGANVSPTTLLANRKYQFPHPYPKKQFVGVF